MLIIILWENINNVLICIICILTLKIYKFQFCLRCLNQQFYSNCRVSAWIWCELKGPIWKEPLWSERPHQTLLGWLEFGRDKAHINCCTIEMIHFWILYDCSWKIHTVHLQKAQHWSSYKILKGLLKYQCDLKRIFTDYTSIYVVPNCSSQENYYAVLF